MNKKRTSVGVLYATLLALCVVSLAAYISAKQQAELEREAELIQLRKEIDEAVKELEQTKERHKLLVEDLERRAVVAEERRRYALSLLESLTPPHRPD